MERAIEMTQKQIDKHLNLGENISGFDGLIEFSGAQKVFAWTNEKIPAYLTEEDCLGKKTAVSVLGGGDHPFNLVKNGIMTIDTFDTNELTEFFALGLKRALILKYNYRDFLEKVKKLFSSQTSFDEIYSIISGLFNYMDKRYKSYWESTCDHYYKSGGRKNLMFALCVKFVCCLANNNYLLDEASYNLLRSRLAKADISFKRADALNLAQEFSGEKYDVMMLSNILDYAHFKWGKNWGYNKLCEYEQELASVANPGCIAYLEYAIELFPHFEEDEIIEKSGITRLDLRDEILMALPGSYDGIIKKKFR